MAFEKPVSTRNRVLDAKDMGSRIKSGWDFAYSAIYTFIEDAVDQSLSCRECGQRVRFFERCCPTCGQFSPTRLSLKAGLLIFGLPIFLLSIYLVQKHAL